MAGQIKQITQGEESIPELPDGIYDAIGMAPGSRIIARVKEQGSSKECRILVPSYLARHVVHGTTFAMTDGELNITKNQKMP